MDTEIKQWMDKIAKSKTNAADLSKDEDLSIALMNLISLEEHFYFTAMKTNDGKYLDFLQEVRTIRTTMQKKIVKNPKGEEWCISKHLLASSMRLFEVGTKELSMNNKKDAEQSFKSAFDLWSMFFAINLDLVDAKKLDSQNLKKESTSMNKLSELMKKVVDCCKEW